MRQPSNSPSRMLHLITRLPSSVMAIPSGDESKIACCSASRASACVQWWRLRAADWYRLRCTMMATAMQQAAATGQYACWLAPLAKWTMADPRVGTMNSQKVMLLRARITAPVKAVITTSSTTNICASG